MVNVKDLTLNTTTLFMVSPLGLKRSELKEYGFLGAYLGDINKPEIYHERGVFMLFKPPSMALFEEWLEFEKLRTFNLVEDYDYEGGYVVVIYTLDEDFAEDFQKFLDGKYSKLSTRFKSTISKTVAIKDNIGKQRQEESIQWQIFRKDKGLKAYWEEEFDIELDDNDEVWGLPNKSDWLDIEKVKKET